MTDTGNHNIWVKQLIEGDEAAYKIFFKEYYQIFAHFAFKYVKDIDVAEDIVHDVILDLYSNKRDFTSLNKLKSFLYLSIKNRCFNYIEHENAKQNYLQASTLQQDEDYFLDAIIEEEVYFLMHKAINELPDQIQTIYELSLIGKSNEEIARVLNLSLDSVKSYKKRGKQILKEKLKGLICFLSVTL